jgi:hypothetical protein
MTAQLRRTILLIGLVFVIGVFTYPAWRPSPEGSVATDFLPELDPELQSAFNELPRSVRTSYQLMSEQNPLMAANMVAARLNPPEPAVEPLPDIANAQLVRQGRFQQVELNEDIDAFDRETPPFNTLYTVSGDIFVYRYPDNRYLIRIEDMAVVNGPDLWLVLSTEPRPFLPAELGRDRIEIGALPSNVGNMNFEIRDVDFNNYNSFVIYDLRYQVVFGFASLN